MDVDECQLMAQVWALNMTQTWIHKLGMDGTH